MFTQWNTVSNTNKCIIDTHKNMDECQNIMVIEADLCGIIHCFQGFRQGLREVSWMMEVFYSLIQVQ